MTLPRKEYKNPHRLNLDIILNKDGYKPKEKEQSVLLLISTETTFAHIAVIIEATLFTKVKERSVKALF